MCVTRPPAVAVTNTTVAPNAFAAVRSAVMR